MEQKDFLLREIEKMGIVLRAILGRLTGNNDNLAISIDNEFEQTNEQLFNETGFALKHFLSLDESESISYLSQFKGINTLNLELLADIILQIAENEPDDKKIAFLKKALLLYKLCESNDKTFSFERVDKISRIKNELALAGDKLL
jgi:hypothetical protein